ncbi:hypothetical protein CEV34_5188 [Brucella pseudogrignonensis]|uniref:Uncharacterized protein n=1 Tax=Brucella pseudogrignonensis TaxID=419475 RepID=A0A256G1P3_9HYPH|nr:hypothetical protein CEV34_5188 [Brucella pseudogrignonensis]
MLSDEIGCNTLFGHGSSQNVLNFLDKRQEGKIASPAF